MAKKRSKEIEAKLPLFKNIPLNGFAYQASETKKAKKSEGVKEIKTKDETLILEATTLWDYPKQSYGEKPKGNNKYAGVTPAFIIWNLVQRYTLPGDLVVDPMAGSGTTIDVCKEEGRQAIGYDIAPAHPEVMQNDARNIPLPNDSVDMIFIDSPYSDNINYSDHPDCIGKISCEDERFFDELDKVAAEIHRVLKPGKVMAWLIGDQWVKKRFTPVGLKLYERLCKYFETVDLICVVRRGQSSNTGLWHNRARRFNFYLRGFKYLFIMRKPSIETDKEQQNRSVKWARYERGGKKSSKTRSASSTTATPTGSG
ncbi:MAG: methyltransferase domain-containing protein [Chloroflexi bacterium]|nr:methyltransferase domain-containing protein [Chloroflexota bacterium]